MQIQIHGVMGAWSGYVLRGRNASRGSYCTPTMAQKPPVHKRTARA